MKRPFSTAVLLLASVMAWGKVTLPDIVSDNMVLQQQTQARLWGWAEPKTEITVHTSWNEETYLARADEKGRWFAANHLNIRRRDRAVKQCAYRRSMVLFRTVEYGDASRGI